VKALIDASREAGLNKSEAASSEAATEDNSNES
jgi:hypothetical protein